MLQAERIDKIKEYLVKNEYADINKLSEIFEVSTATIRRSLKQLEKEKIVDLTHGGAILAKKGILYEYPYQIKQQMNAEEKRRISQQAIQYIDKNESIFLDSSSTVFEMTRFLPRLGQITVATNDLYIAQNLTNAENVAVTVVGGSLRKHYYTLTGYFSDLILQNLRFDHAFLGIDTISQKGGLMITNIEEVQFKRKVLERANKIIVICDHSKFEKESFLKVCDIRDVDVLITGKELDKDISKRYADASVNIVLA